MILLKQLITPPVFEDEIKMQQAYMLHVIVWTLICVPIPFVLYTLAMVPQNTTRTLIQATFAESVNILLLIMLRHGYVRSASIIQVSAFWVFFTGTALTGSGVLGEAYLLGYGLVIVIAGILLGGVGAFMFTALSLAMGGLIVYMDSLGSVTFLPPGPPLTTWIVSLVLFPVGAVLQHLSSLTVRKALKRAHMSEERYRLISRVSSDYTFSTELDPQGNMRLNWVAGAFEDITGYTYEEYVARGAWPAHLYSEDIEKDSLDLAALHENHKVITEIRTHKKNGELRWVRVYAHPIWDESQNQLKGIAGAVKDITDEKLAEGRESNRQAMLEKVIQLGKVVTEVSDLWTTLDEIWHGVHDDLGFDRVGIFLHNFERNSMDSTLGSDLEGNQVNNWGIWFPISEGAIFNTVLEKPDGLYFTHNYDVENNIPPGNEMYGVKDFAAVAAWGGNKPVAVICVDNVLSDASITSGQLEALRLYAGYAGLAIENSRLNASLQNELVHRQTFITELETKNVELERFTYTVSHDLKSPLVTITGFLGFLEQDALAGNHEKVKAGVQRISSAAKKMENLLSDLLELSRIGRLANPSEMVPFSDIIHEAMERVHGRLEAANVQVKLQKAYPIVYGDKQRLIEVVQNLLDNAAKFSKSRANALIEIGTRGTDDAGNSVFFVRDNGIGIDPKFHERIFGLFNKLNTDIDGTGIGLTLVKRIVEIHGGRIWVESELDQGATFFFTLPEKKE